ncbi:MAG TPA: hypothetical protein VIB00_17105 [Pyrinomonadaceae bacterium]|jgi:hypothetical protein
MENVKAPACDRTDNLISLLYDEASEAEILNFKEHLRSCSQCRDEYASFTEIRKPIIAWRQQSLGYVTSPLVQSLESEPARRSAIGAVREFFNLSPMWLQGAVAFASVLFCVLVVLTVIGLRKTDNPAGSNPQYTQQELDALIEQRAEEKLAELKKNEREQVVAVEEDYVQPDKIVKKVRPVRAKAAQTRRPLTRQERLQLAADLRLTSSSDESDLFLLSDRLNGQDE